MTRCSHRNLWLYDFDVKIETHPGQDALEYHVEVPTPN
jgi:hypothetical protein